MKKKHPVILTEAQREQLNRPITAGTAPARKLTHARILLKADQSPQGLGWVDEKVAEALEVSQPTVARVRKHYFEEGLEAALNRRPLAYSARPEGAERHHSGDEQSPGLRPASRAGHPRTRSRTLYPPGRRIAC